MDNAQFLDTVLRPVTRFLDQSLHEVEASGSLSSTAAPLIQAIETVPGSGRVAVFLNGKSDAVPSFVSGSSFAASEIENLTRIVSELTTEPGSAISLEAALPTEDGAANRVRLFPLSVPGEIPTATLVTVRDPVDDDSCTVFDAFMDQIAQLAGIVLEDRRLRSKTADQQSVLKVVLDAAPDAVIRIDQAGTILDFVGSAAQIFGWSPEEIIGLPVSTLMPEPHASRHDGYIEAFLNTGERKLPDFGRQLEGRHKSGHIFPIELALNQLQGREGVEFLGIVRDISRRVEREAEMDAMREALDAAALQSALGELAATIAHELIQPITAVANYMDALELRLENPTEENLVIAADLAKKTAAQARLGGEIIRRTRRMALKGETEVRPDDFHAAVAEALAVVSKAPAAIGVTVEHVQEGANEAVPFDRVQIQQVVMNLATNAFRAMVHSKRRVLTVISRQTDEVLELVVRDTGPGVSEADKARIFNRFFRRSETGMGLGLSVVKRIAEAHGGEIRVEDANGGGAEFTLTLPRRVV